jgi:alpha-galactosidase
MRGPKIVVIGAGSYFFGKPIIKKMATSPALAGGTLALVDTKPAVLATMSELARRIFRHTGCDVRVIGSTDRCEVLADADFIVLTFSDRNAYFRGLDTQIAARHGIRMCSSDTIGPGGIFRALREVPHVLAMARDAAELAPNAWVINFVNPTTVLGIALRRYAPQVRSFALCDGQHELYNTLHWCQRVGILPRACPEHSRRDATTIPPEVASRLDLVIAGVNHCTWMLRFNYDGRDMLPVWRAELERQVELEQSNPQLHSKARFNSWYALQLWDIYGYYPTVIGHTKEYVPFFQGYGISPIVPEPITLFDAEQRTQEMAAAWAITEQYAAGALSSEEFLTRIPGDHASDIIESVWGGLGKSFYINTDNRGAVPNLPDDAFLELRCDVDLRGPRPQPAVAFPRGLLALQHQILDTHELTAEAAATGDRALLRRAMLTDPICNNIGDADNCIRDLLEAERDALPDYWYC